MDNLMLLAMIFGPLLAILGLWMLLYSDNHVKVMTSMKNTPSAFYLSGVINLLIGLTIVNQYNVWMWNAGLLITILGWVMILRGVLALFIPQVIIKLLMSNASIMKVIGIVPLIWGLAICWMAMG